MFRWIAQVEKNQTLIFLQEAVLISVNNLMSMLFALCCLELNRRRRYYSMFLTFHFALQWMDATMKFKLDVFSSRYKYYVNSSSGLSQMDQPACGCIRLIFDMSQSSKASCHNYTHAKSGINRDIIGQK